MPRIIDAFAQFFDDAGDPLENGWLRFTESGTNNTDKDTYADVDQTIANANPLQLDAAGRCPNNFGSGSYRVVSYTNDDILQAPAVQIQMFDPVVAGGGGSEGLGSDWSYLSVYNEGDIVKGSDGKFYASLTESNQNNNPVTDTVNWEQVEWVHYWNANKIYQIGDIVRHTNGTFYISLQASQFNNDPDDSPTYWRALMVRTWDVADTYGENEVVYYTDGSMWRSLIAANTGNNPTTDDGTKWTSINAANVITQTGGGVLIPYRINELQDSNTYTLPLASVVPAGGWVIVEVTDEYSAETPTVQRAGTDTITDKNGTDTEVLFNVLDSTIVRFISDGISDWRI